MHLETNVSSALSIHSKIVRDSMIAEHAVSSAMKK